MTGSRWAVYWTPEPAHPLWRAGCEWLGRDPAADTDGVPPPHRRAPWRYGFHATLKAPMPLRDAIDPALFALLGRWGYPHVFERWRFHLTLSDPIPPADAERRSRLERDAKAHCSRALRHPLHARSLCVFVEDRPGAPLRLAQRSPLRAT